MTAQRPAKNRQRLLSAAAIIAVVAVVVAWFLWGRTSGLPQPGSDGYEQTTRSFYRGLAGLDVGLIDGAVQDLRRAAELAPREPAVWANLGLAHLRLGAFDDAVPSIERAAALAPDSGAIAFLQGRLETARGRRDEAIAHLRRAVALDPQSLHARTALIQEIENAAGPDADAEAQRLLEEMVALQPENPALLVERGRLAAKRGDFTLLQDSLARLDRFTSGWPPEVMEQYGAVQQAATTANAADSSRGMAFLRNVLARVPLFLESRRLVTPSAELIAEPFTRFLRLPVPSATPAAPDLALTFTREVVGQGTTTTTGDGTTAATAVIPVSLDGNQPPVVIAADALSIRRVDQTASTLLLPDASADMSSRHLVALDWNHDFRMDLLVTGGGAVRLFLQAADGSFVDETPRASQASGSLTLNATGVWAADVEMDGDLDVVVGLRGEAPIVLRNNGDVTWQVTRPFGNVFAPAAFVDGTGGLSVMTNLQAGQFQPMSAPAGTATTIGLALGDVNADGVLDLVTMDRAGLVRRSSWGTNGWAQDAWTSWPAAGNAGPVRLTIADLDNNGALDLVAGAQAGSAIWLADETLALELLNVTIEARIDDVIDLGNDGVLDLVGVEAGQPVRFIGRGTRGYHYQVVRPRAQTAAGDQRINSFGVGGLVEVRSGRLVQKQVITRPVVHVGLGDHTSVDVTRIVWPNGVPQAEFDPAIDGPLVAEQRLKGSCPWVFADDGTGMKFVTDFLWRSPLGLRINAQDTAGVTQTEDWVRIRGDQLVARNGAYDIRISAELWETHFVDHVSLMVVDHPADVDVFVDERFVPVAPPALALHATSKPVPVARAWDQAGRDVSELVARQDGTYLNTFDRGPYQGIASEHFVEIELGAPIPTDGSAWIVALGWVYPTDSSINVAIAQGSHAGPRSLSLEARDADGRWVVVASDLGFPAGKNKTVLIDLAPVVRAGLGGSTRLRLRTNLEIYWDSIATARSASGAGLRTQRVAPARADLGYRGYSQLTSERRDVPETPIYERIANTMPRWRDLVGYYTRFGDVRELLATVEDRYMIMNAGDELRLSFPAPPPPQDGWTRDFVLVGDGWVKDGDYNTSYSKTVLPLPTHATADYLAPTPAPILEHDPMYMRHREDWLNFHTRYIAPHAFVGGLTSIRDRDRQ